MPPAGAAGLSSSSSTALSSVLSGTGDCTATPGGTASPGSRPPEPPPGARRRRVCVKRLHGGMDSAQLVQLIKDLLDLTGELRRAEFATPAAGAAWSGCRARLGPPGAPASGALSRPLWCGEARYPRLISCPAPVLQPCLCRLSRFEGRPRRRGLVSPLLSRGGSGGLRAMVRG